MTLLAATSWACTPQASLKVTPSSGAPGTLVTVSGSTFDAAGQPVKIFWGGASGSQVASTTVVAARTFSTTFVVPQSAGGVVIVSATQRGADGNYIAGSPVNTTFRVEGPAAAVATATNLQGDPENTITEPAPAPAVESAPAQSATAAPAAPRVRVAAPARTTAAAAAPSTPAPAPAVETAPAAQPTPAPAVEPAPAAAAPAAPATEPARRSVMVSMAGDGSDSSPALAIGLVGIGLLLALGASAVVLASRRESKAPAKARR